jgi:predicted anti-sigma-YlaC factor YlaD
MNCREARELFDLHVDGALDAAVGARLNDHLRGCSSCQVAYQTALTENHLLKQALQADLSSAEEIARIEARVARATRRAGSPVAGLWEWAGPVSGIVMGLLVLVAGRFDSVEVREAICLSLNPRGGLPVALPSILMAAVGILLVITVQSLIFRTRTQH